MDNEIPPNECISFVIRKYVTQRPFRTERLKGNGNHDMVGIVTEGSCGPESSRRHHALSIRHTGSEKISIPTSSSWFQCTWHSDSPCRKEVNLKGSGLLVQCVTAMYDS